MTICTVLVANRGEIACRIFRSVRALGLRTVAVYSEADAEAPMSSKRMRLSALGPAAASESYLNLDRTMEAARQSGADAIHPGYGFFSENPDLPERCQKAGLTGLVPPPKPSVSWVTSGLHGSRWLLGASLVCRATMGKCKAMSVSSKRRNASAFRSWSKPPWAVGARHAFVHLEGVPDALQTARREAAAAFGDGSLILERAVVEPKHVEVQIFADRLGSVVHLGERECLAAPAPKVIEEAPSPALDEALRARMGTAAVEVARAKSTHVGAGTVEFS